MEELCALGEDQILVNNIGFGDISFHIFLFLLVKFLFRLSLDVFYFVDYLSMVFFFVPGFGINKFLKKESDYIMLLFCNRKTYHDIELWFDMTQLIGL